jgi:hypothetical protein
MANSKSTNPTPAQIKQAGILFATIAEKAEASRQLCHMAVAGLTADVDDDTCTALVAATALCAEIGLFADMGAMSMGNGLFCVNAADPARWLLPPVFQTGESEAING